MHFPEGGVVLQPQDSMETHWRCSNRTGGCNRSCKTTAGCRGGPGSGRCGAAVRRRRSLDRGLRWRRERKACLCGWRTRCRLAKMLLPSKAWCSSPWRAAFPCRRLGSGGRCCSLGRQTSPAAPCRRRWPLLCGSRGETVSLLASSAGPAPTAAGAGAGAGAVGVGAVVAVEERTGCGEAGEDGSATAAVAVAVAVANCSTPRKSSTCWTHPGDGYLGHILSGCVCLERYGRSKNELQPISDYFMHKKGAKFDLTEPVWLALVRRSQAGRNWRSHKICARLQRFAVLLDGLAQPAPSFTPRHTFGLSVHLFSSQPRRTQGLPRAFRLSRRRTPLPTALGLFGDVSALMSLSPELASPAVTAAGPCR